jgi:iron complex transport system substrate-binding protein
MTRGVATLVVLALAVLLPVASAQDIVVRDDRGVEHRFAAPPQRIVTLLPSLTESIWALGGGARLVGVDRYSNWPVELAHLPRLGGLEDAQIEAIASLKPDVVLASTSARALDRLEALGFRVIRLKSETHADVHRTLNLLATLLGTPAEADRVWADVERETKAAAARVPEAQRGRRVYFELGGGPYAAGTTSFIGETLGKLGMNNIVPAQYGPFPKLNPEFVFRAKPDIVMGPERDVNAMTSRPGWGELPAVRNAQRCGFTSAEYDMLVRPGPRMGNAAAVVADCLQGLEAPR